MMVPRTAALVKWELRSGGLLVLVGGYGPPHERIAPPGYSRVWRALDRNAEVYAPVPLNFVLWQLPWRYSAAMSWLIGRGVFVGPEGAYYRDFRVEWRPWRWRGRRVA